MKEDVEWEAWDHTAERDPLAAAKGCIHVMIAGAATWVAIIAIWRTVR